MAVLKVIEVLSSSNKSFEDAIEKAIKKADKSLKIFAPPMYIT